MLILSCLLCFISLKTVVGVLLTVCGVEGVVCSHTYFSVSKKKICFSSHIYWILLTIHCGLILLFKFLLIKNMLTMKVHNFLDTNSIFASYERARRRKRKEIKTKPFSSGIVINRFGSIYLYGFSNSKNQNHHRFDIYGITHQHNSIARGYLRRQPVSRDNRPRHATKYHHYRHYWERISMLRVCDWYHIQHCLVVELFCVQFLINT